MRYEKIKEYKNGKFKRLTGVKKETFEKMVQAVKADSRDFGRPPKLIIEDQILMTLMYWREYRTQFHIGETYEVSEATVSRVIKRIEDILTKSGEFTLPGKKVLQESETVIEFIVVDVAEQPIERPKKSKKEATAEKRNDIPKKHR